VHRVGPIIPKYYYVSRENVEAEKVSPGSQVKVASDEDAETGNIYLWGQSVYVISQLLSQLPHNCRLLDIRQNWVDWELSMIYMMLVGGSVVLWLHASWLLRL